LESKADGIVKELRIKNQEISNKYLQKEKQAEEEYNKKIQEIISNYQKEEAEIDKENREIEEDLKAQ